MRRECLSLVTRTVGGRIKVVDAASIHNDHAIALAGAAEVVLSGAGTFDMGGALSEIVASLRRTTVNSPELSSGAEYGGADSTNSGLTQRSKWR